VAGMLGEPKDRQMMSFKTWRLAILLFAFLHTIAGRPWESTWSSHRHLCGAHRDRPSRIPTATLSSSLRPQLAIGRARSQSPLCGATEAKNLAFCDGSTKESLMRARSFGVPTCPRMIVYRARELEVAQLK